jgi:hypothetical protein
MSQTHISLTHISSHNHLRSHAQLPHTQCQAGLTDLERLVEKVQKEAKRVPLLLDTSEGRLVDTFYTFNTVGAIY